jgi:hypothetical protein
MNTRAVTNCKTLLTMVSSSECGPPAGRSNSECIGLMQLGDGTAGCRPRRRRRLNISMKVKGIYRSRHETLLGGEMVYELLFLWLEKKKIAESELKRMRIIVLIC